MNLYFYPPTNERVILHKHYIFGLVEVRNKSKEFFIVGLWELIPVQ